VALEDPNIDLITDHFYPNQPATFEDRLDHMLAQTTGKKPFLVSPDDPPFRKRACETGR
jgi:hypothetical protein